MSEGEALPWSPIDWSDEDGGTIRLWPHLPTVVSTDALRRTVGDWQGLAFLLPPDEPEDWAEQVVEERDNPGVNRDTLAYQGGAYGRMMEGLISIDSVQTGRFPDPEPRRIHRAAISAERPTFFVEPDDEEWHDWVEDCADEMAQFRTLIRQVFAGRAWKRAMKAAMLRIEPPAAERSDAKAQGLAEASAYCAAWWALSERLITTELAALRDQRYAARLRGALATLREGQVDGGAAPVLLVPVMQAWMPTLHTALENGVESESLLEDET